MAVFGSALMLLGVTATRSVVLEIWRYRFVFSFSSIVLFLVLSFPLFFGLLLVSQSAGWKMPYRVASSLAMASVAAFTIHAISMITWAFVS